MKMTWGLDWPEQYFSTFSPPRRVSRKRPLAVAAVAALLTALPLASEAEAQVLGTAESFAVLGGQTVTNTGSSVIRGDVGVSPGGAITGFPPGVVVAGTFHRADAVAAQAQSHLTTAYNTLQDLPFDENKTGQNLGGLFLMPGVYRFDSSALLTGVLTLDGGATRHRNSCFRSGAR